MDNQTDFNLEDARQRIHELEDLVTSLSMKIQMLEMQNSDLKIHLQYFQKENDLWKQEEHLTSSWKNMPGPAGKLEAFNGPTHNLVGSESFGLEEKGTHKPLEPSILGICKSQENDVSVLRQEMLVFNEGRGEEVMTSACSKTLSVHQSDFVSCRMEPCEANLIETTYLKKSQPSSSVKKKNKENGYGLGGIPLHTKRHIALKLMYLGARFHGFASDASKGCTVESELFAALERTKLWPGDPVTACYSRCGRTDKGVSATGQVVALFLRSCQKCAESDSSSVFSLESTSSNVQNANTGDRIATARESRTQEAYFATLPDDQELDYVALLNRALPDDIRILGWCPVPDGFHARFSCLSREYAYYFLDNGDLNIEAMKVACEKLVGDHDFRNFCKMDATNVHNYRRTIIAFDILPCLERSAGMQLWMFQVKGSAFLWHQVRCMVAVLLMIGEGKESPQVVDELLDVQKTARKPQYQMAPSLSLVLQSCDFQGLSFRCLPRTAMRLHLHLEGQRRQFFSIDAILKNGLDQVPLSGECWGKSIIHIPLTLRHTEPSYEERCSKQKKYLEGKEDEQK